MSTGPKEREKKVENLRWAYWALKLGSLGQIPHTWQLETGKKAFPEVC